VQTFLTCSSFNDFLQVFEFIFPVSFIIVPPSSLIFTLSKDLLPFAFILLLFVLLILLIVLIVVLISLILLLRISLISCFSCFFSILNVTWFESSNSVTIIALHNGHF